MSSAMMCGKVMFDKEVKIKVIVFVDTNESGFDWRTMYTE